MGVFHINHSFALLYLPTKHQYQRTQNSSCNVDPAMDPVVNIYLPNFSVCNSQEFFQRISALLKVICKFQNVLRIIKYFVKKAANGVLFPAAVITHLLVI